MEGKAVLSFDELIQQKILRLLHVAQMIMFLDCFLGLGGRIWSCWYKVYVYIVKRNAVYSDLM